MPVSLPIELQHRILETALPLLGHCDLDERVQLCKTFSLVHRSWTPVAQRELHEHFSTTLLGGAWRFSGEYGRLVAAQVGGGPVKRLNLKLIGYAENVVDTDYADKQPLHPFPPVEGAPTFEEMLVGLEGRGTPVWHGGKADVYLDSLPANLTYLALSGVTIDVVPPTPHIRVFRYWRNLCLIPVAELLGAFPDLQVIEDVAHDVSAVYKANVALPSALESCVFVESVSANRKEKRAIERMMTRACEAVDADLRYSWVEEVGDLDFDEWALSVGS
ncbi:hypothetical protein JCM10296v2_007202 [Rhodotorula toruloides]